MNKGSDYSYSPLNLRPDLLLSGLRIWFGFSLWVLEMCLCVSAKDMPEALSQSDAPTQPCVFKSSPRFHTQTSPKPSVPLCDLEHAGDSWTQHWQLSEIPSCIIHESGIHIYNYSWRSLIFSDRQSVVADQKHINTSAMWSEIIIIVQPHIICLLRQKTKL